MRWLVKSTRAVMPAGAGAASASWAATASGFGSGIGPPPVAAKAIAVPPQATTTIAAIHATRWRVEIVRREMAGCLIPVTRLLQLRLFELSVSHEEPASSPVGAAGFEPANLCVPNAAL